MLRKFLRSSLLALLLAPFAAAQFTLVSGTVVDPNGLPYALGTITAQLITAGVSPTVNGNSFAMTGSAGLNSTGSFTMQLVSNALMVPSTLQWSFQVCSAIGTVQPAGGPGPVCFTTLITISGATQNISATLSAAAPALTNSNGSGLLSATVTLSTAQITSLTTTAVTLVPAPGAGKAIMPIAAFWEMVHAGASFTGGASQAIDLSYNSVAATELDMGPDPTATVGFWGAAVSVVRQVLNPNGGNSYQPASSSVANLPLTVFNFGTALGAGGTSTVKVVIIYDVMTL